MNRLLKLAAAALVAATGAVQAEPLKVAYNQWAGFAPVFVAADKGYFEQEGVDVELVSFAGPSDSIPPLIAGHIDVSLTTPDSIIPVNEPQVRALTVMMLDASHGGDGIVAKAGIDGVGDLEGKRVAVTLGQVNHLLLMLALEQAGIAADDVRLTNMNADDAGAAFIAGRLDAAVTWEPWLSKAESEGAGKVLFTSADAPGMLIDVAAVTPKTLAQRERDLAAFARAVDRGLAEMKENPTESSELVGKWLGGVPGDEVTAMLEGIRLYSMEDNRKQFAGDDGIVDSMEKIQQFLVDQERSKGKVAAEKMVDGRLFTH